MCGEYWKQALCVATTPEAVKFIREQITEQTEENEEHASGIVDDSDVEIVDPPVEPPVAPPVGDAPTTKKPEEQEPVPETVPLFFFPRNFAFV